MTEDLLLERKGETRKAALARRKAVQNDDAAHAACDRLLSVLDDVEKGVWISGYMAILSEIDPMRAMRKLHDGGHRICLPVIQGRGQPLLFRPWTPDCAMIEGDFGALIPRSGDFVDPGVLIVPLVAFDANGQRMGYGGGFYDRTLEGLRARGSVRAIGFAFAGQETDILPTEDTDQRLDAIVTESGVRSFG